MTESEQIRLSSGLTAVRVRPREGSRGDVLLLHGMMGGAWQFSGLQGVLAEANFGSLAINYRGHHGSPCAKPLGRVSVLDYVADAREAAALLGRPLAVGQSMGGLIALKLAEAGAVAAAALVCALPPRGVCWSGAFQPRRVLRRLPVMLRGGPLIPDRRELDALIFNRVPREDRARLFSLQIPESSRVVLEIALGACAVDPRRVCCPILSVAAEDDALVSAAVGRKLAERYRGQCLDLPHRGHYALVAEPGWQDVARSISEFFTQAIPC